MKARGLFGTNASEGLATTVQGAPMDPAKFERMKAAFERAGGTIDQSADAVRYLDMRGAEGLTLNAETMLLRPNPSASAVFEEFIHVGQFRRGRIDSSSGLLMEIEAAERLINNRKAWGIPSSETRATIDRLRGFREMLR
ncbi:MAG: hypothetical protein EOP87_23340 [Verrucomicrobiaceae bacterium]|nr:MAG: hypothetical protein EOP87_23340 [Verrucomicrobiaceae bacterium]